MGCTAEEVTSQAIHAQVESVHEVSISGPDGAMHVTFYPCIEQVKDVWPELVSATDIFMSYPYLRLIQSYPPSSIRPFYAVLTDKNREVCALYYLQEKRFKGREALNYGANSDRTSTWRRMLNRSISGLLNANGIVLGNLLVTGQHGIYWVGEHWTPEVKWRIHRQVIGEAKSYIQGQGRKCSYVLCKDYAADLPEGDGLPLDGVKVQPRMILPVAWSSTMDYLGAMKSKYRKRNRSAMRKMEGCHLVEAQAADVAEHIDDIYRLYLDIVERAVFNMFVLPRDYFLHMKTALGDRCRFSLYFHDDRLVAFQVNLINERFFEAHFLGYDMEMVKSHDLYLNLLLHTVEEAIELKMPAVDFSRTAMQIKSSIGAVPEELYLYVHGHRPLIHRYFARTVESLMPEVPFDLRHPFKSADVKG